MSSPNQIQFFMTKNDILSILTSLEHGRDIKYVKSGLFNDEKAETFDSVEEIIKSHYMVNGDANSNPVFLILPSDQKIIIREVTQLNGLKKYGIDQLKNSHSVAINLGGKFEKGSLIAGKVGTVSDTPASLEIFELIKNEITGSTRKLKGYYIGREAYSNFKEGYRLTANIQSPKEYDLSEAS